ncbi:hypothetical protein EV360DRAFT_75333 [Lentinula raphanica]|nr:hypothetical protein EV360DRAFT_75333 [Lentinula raphanica]
MATASVMNDAVEGTMARKIAHGMGEKVKDIRGVECTRKGRDSPETLGRLEPKHRYDLQLGKFLTECIERLVALRMFANMEQSMYERRFSEEILAAFVQAVYDCSSQSPEESSTKDILNLLLVNKQFNRIAQEKLYGLLRVCFRDGMSRMTEAWKLKYGKRWEEHVLPKVQHIAVGPYHYLCCLPAGSANFKYKICPDVFPFMSTALNLQQVSLNKVILDDHFVPWATNLPLPIQVTIANSCISQTVVKGSSFNIATLVMYNNATPLCPLGFEQINISFAACCKLSLLTANLAVDNSWGMTDVALHLPQSIQTLVLHTDISISTETARHTLAVIASCTRLIHLSYHGYFPAVTKKIPLGSLQTIYAPLFLVANIAALRSVKSLDLTQTVFSCSFDKYLVNFSDVEIIKFKIKGRADELAIEVMADAYPSVKEMTVVWENSENITYDLQLATFNEAIEEMKSIERLTFIEIEQKWLRLSSPMIQALKAIVVENQDKGSLTHFWLNERLIWVK